MKNLDQMSSMAFPSVEYGVSNPFISLGKESLYLKTVDYSTIVWPVYRPYLLSQETNEDQGRTEGESTAAHPSRQVHPH